MVDFWADKYFNGRYFSSRYFQTGGGSSSSTVDLAAVIVGSGSLVATLQVGDQSTVAFSGGFSSRRRRGQRASIKFSSEFERKRSGKSRSEISNRNNRVIVAAAISAVIGVIMNG